MTFVDCSGLCFPSIWKVSLSILYGSLCFRLIDFLAFASGLVIILEMRSVWYVLYGFLRVFTLFIGVTSGRH